MTALALHMRLRKELLKALVAHVEHPDLSSAELGEQLGISRARAADLRARRTELFSLDALVELAGRAGFKVEINATRPYHERHAGRRRAAGRGSGKKRRAGSRAA
jgi:predicted XRE-type DNA-binding protein